MLRAGASEGPSAVLLVKGIPVAAVDKPELLMRMLMRQAGLFKAYAFFPGPAAAAAAEFDKPNVAKQVLCLTQMHRAHLVLQDACIKAVLQDHITGTTEEFACLRATLSGNFTAAVMPRALFG